LITLIRLLVIFLTAFLFIPTAVIVASSFTAGRVVSFPPEGFSLKWYVAALTSAWFLKGMVNSVVAAAICTLLAIPIGVLASYALIRYRVRFRNVIQVYLLLPFTIPLVVQGLSLLVVYSAVGVAGNLFGVGFALMEINLPFMIWSISSNINALDKNLEYASMSLGANEVRTFIYVTMPSIMPGIISGALLMFILGLNEFITSLILVTLDTQTFPVVLYSQIRFSISPSIAAAATTYIALAFIAVLIIDKVVGLKNYLR